MKSTRGRPGSKTSSTGRRLVSREWLEEASRAVEPIHGQGFFYVGYNYISYYLVFDYVDPLGYYDVVLGDESLFEEETTRLYYSMQELVDKEKVVVNSVKVRPRVVMVDIGRREKKGRVFIVFALRFSAPLKPGVNVYENYYDGEEVEYDYEAYWVFPPRSRILEVDMGSTTEEWDIVGGNLLAIYARRGGRTGGYERIVFELPPPTPAFETSESGVGESG